MRYRILKKWNAILGALSLLLAGCASSQKIAKQRAYTESIMCLYGIPVEQYEKNDTTQDTIPTPKDSPKKVDSLIAEPQIQVKYGIPFPRQ